MNHYSREHWMRYVENQVTSEERDEYEAHLYQCDACLAVFLACLEQAELQPAAGQAPEADLTEAVMRRIAEEQDASMQTKASVIPFKRMPIYRRTWFHYTAAAVITLLLMSTGMLQTAFYNDIRTEWEERPSISDQLMKKTVNMIDTIQQDVRGENRS